VADAAVEFAALARALKEAGETGLRKELYDGINEAAKPVVDQIKALPHLRDYMPDRYADVFAGDLKVTTSKRTGTEPGVTLLGRAPTLGRGGRKIAQRNAGVITHPEFAQAGTPRRSWRWRTQTAGMRPGFFDDPVERAGPEVRRQIEAALRRVIDRIYAAR
jgi:hypothetical protein